MRPTRLWPIAPAPLTRPVVIELRTLHGTRISANPSSTAQIGSTEARTVEWRVPRPPQYRTRIASGPIGSSACPMGRESAASASTTPPPRYSQIVER